MLKLYGSDLSVFSNKIKFTANVLGIEYEFKFMNLAKGEHKSPEYLKIHPAGKVPAIDDDGFTLFESNSIIRYLADKQETSLYSRDIKKRAVIDQWMDFSSLHVSNGINKVVFNRVFAPRMKRPVDEQSIKDGLIFLEQFFPVVDTQLGANIYLAGDELTLADLTLLSALDPVEIASIDITPYANIVKWRQALKQKDFYTAVHSEYGSALKG